MFVFIGFVILSYYSVVAGWALRYFIDSFSGAYMAEPTEYFLAAASGMDAIAYHAVFMLAVIIIVAFGVQRGIELSVKVMVPAIVLLGIGLAIYVYTIPNAAAGYAYYLSPDPGVIAENWTSILPAAAGQAFFTLSLGMGVMITYSSYLSENENLAEDGLVIIGFDTGIAFIAGLIVFPILFSAGVDPADPGAGAVFISLAGAFADIPLGWLIGALFFGTLTIAALSSAISLMEVVVAYMIDEHGFDRRLTTFVIGVAMFLFGIPTALNLTYVDLYDIFAAQILLVFGGLLLMILVGWLNADKALDELGRGIGRLGAWGTTWLWLVRVPVIIVLVVSLVLAIQGYIEFLQANFLG